MASNDQRPHIKVEGFSARQSFATPHSARASFKVAERNRRAHGRELLRQLRDLTPAAQNRIDAQHQLSDDIPSGVYIQFESEPDFELATESLAREASGIELLSVKEVGKRHVATVFVPEGKLGHFEALVRAYMERDSGTKEKKPAHQNLISNIARIRLATARGLWTDHPDLYPATQDESIWWEVWLRVGDDRDGFIQIFRNHGKEIGLDIPARELRFLERTVVAARGNLKQLTQSVTLLNSIAELRCLKNAAKFFVDLKPSDQRQWVEDAHDRIEWAGAEAPAVCLLDTGVTSEHPLLGPAFAQGDLHTIQPAWGATDMHGHGTLMAGLALHGDLTEFLSATGAVRLLHNGESVKILNQDGGNEGELYGDVCREAISRAEAASPNRARTVCLAVTATKDIDRGKPSSWSATMDALASGAEDEQRRLIVISAGNTKPEGYSDYPSSNAVDSIHDPAQSWNALTVGAVTYKTDIDVADAPGWTALAPHGDLSPYSCTSTTWESGWPLKPDIVMEGGNIGVAQGDDPSGFAELDLLSTYHQSTERPLDLMWGTSAAAALTARLAARIQASYPTLWPETVRGLIVHSADWTPAMHERHQPLQSRQHARILLQHCGHGVPSEVRALYSAGNALTLIAEDEIIPFEAVTDDRGRVLRFHAREMNLHSLPWPIDELNALGELPVEMRVTLSYFVEPNPSSRGWTKRYIYESHGLRFDVKRPHEDDQAFVGRINLKARAEEDARHRHTSEDSGWVLGPRLRHTGSCHSDRWHGTAADLAARGRIAVYPTMGWWRERRAHERWNSAARFALIVSISTPATDVDLYAAIQSQVQVSVSTAASK